MVGAVVVAGLATVAEVGAGLAFCVDAAVGGVAGVQQVQLLRQLNISNTSQESFWLQAACVYPFGNALLNGLTST